MFKLVHMCLRLCLVHFGAEILSLLLFNGTVSVSVFPWWHLTSFPFSHRHIQSLQYLFIALINITRHQMLSKCTSKSVAFKLILTGIQAYYTLFVDSFITLLTWTHQQTHLTWFQPHLCQTSRGYPEFRVCFSSKHCSFKHCLWILLYVLSFFCLSPSDTRPKNLHMSPLHSRFVTYWSFLFIIISFYTDNTWLCNLHCLLQNLAHSWPSSFKLYYCFSQVNR